MDCKPKEGNLYDVRVDAGACKQCGYCLEVCPRDVFVQTGNFNDRGYQSVAVKSVEECIGCRRCFFACPDFAIDVVVKQAGKEQRHEANI